MRFKIYVEGCDKGSPLSSLVFAWALDGALRWYIHRAPPEAHLSAFADDLALLIAMSEAVLKLLRSFEGVLCVICGLAPNHKKLLCVCVPLTSSLVTRCVRAMCDVGEKHPIAAPPHATLRFVHTRTAKSVRQRDLEN